MNAIKVLLVEDDEDDYLLTRQRLREIYNSALTLDWADSYEKAETAIRNGGHDVCLLDYRLGQHDGLELLKLAREAHYSAPIILITGQGARDIDMEAMQAGAADYLVKGELNSALLERAIRYAIQQKRSETERLELIREQAARQQAEEASRQKDEFLAVVSHELKTPLHAIKGWAELLRQKRLSPNDADHAIEAIARNARAQQEIIDDLLDVSRIVTGKLRLEFQPISIRAILNAAVDTIRPSAEAKNIKLSLGLHPLPEKILGDQHRLQQVIWNLLSNAVKFTPEGGHIKITAEQIGEQVKITVQDNGQGINSNFLPHVFDRFRQEDASTQRKQSGLGLGLSIVRQLVEMHGGTVCADSLGTGEGARFVIHLPVQSGDRRNQISPIHETALPEGKVFKWSLSGTRVLIVDDEKDSRDLIKHIVMHEGVEVRTASNAATAYDVIDKWLPDVIISDIGMPDVDGYDFIRQLRIRMAQQNIEIPAVALTAFSRSEDRLRAIAAGFQMHVTKPVEPLELLTVLASLTGKIE